MPSLCHVVFVDITLNILGNKRHQTKFGLSSYFLQRVERPAASSPSFGVPGFQRALPVASGTIQRRATAAGAARREPADGEPTPESSRQSRAFGAKTQTACSASAVNPTGRRQDYRRYHHLERQNANSVTLKLMWRNSYLKMRLMFDVGLQLTFKLSIYILVYTFMFNHVLKFLSCCCEF